MIDKESLCGDKSLMSRICILNYDLCHYLNLNATKK